MHIKIENLGPIHEFDFSLEKDFSVIFGKNNIGKSYAISVIYLILKNLLSAGAARSYFFVVQYDLQRLLSESDFGLKECVKNLKHNETIDIKSKIESLLAAFLQRIFVDGLNESFHATFDNIEKLENKLSTGKIRITIEADVATITLGVKDKALCIQSALIKTDNVSLKKIKAHRGIKKSGNNVYLYCSDESDILEENVTKYLIGKISTLTGAIKQLIENVYYLPASRSGLYQALSAFSQIFAELSKSRGFLRKKVEIPGISEPLSDYFLWLSDIKTRKPEAIGDIAPIVFEIEKEILGGEVTIDDRKKILYKPYNLPLTLDVSSTSSMVSEISPIVSYLKYIITIPKKGARGKDLDASRQQTTPKPLIFIEEPEAHLHPEIQVKLMGAFAKLIGANVKIVMTSHSNYFFAKINNLILDKTIKPNCACAMVFKTTSEGSVVHSVPIDQYGMDDENFVDISENLYNERESIIQLLNKRN